MSIIHHFNLAGVDLNLLVVFDAVMSEQHLTRAAEKIGLSQPATSNALSRLRKLFKDELFIKTSKGMTPTPKAIALADPVHQILLQIQSALSHKEDFIPETSERVFYLGMDDYAKLVFLPDLMRKISYIAPKMKIFVRPSDWQKAPKMLDAEEIDIAIGHYQHWQSWHQHQMLLQERFVSIASFNHSAIGETLMIEDYLSASHMLVSSSRDIMGMVDEILEKHNLKRHVVISIPDFLVIPLVVANTDLIATLPERLAKSYAHVLNLRVLPLPFAAPEFSVDLLWHSRNNNDPAHIWLRTLITQIV